MSNPFFTSMACLSRDHCRACRDPGSGSDFRRNLEGFSFPHNDPDTPCPWGYNGTGPIPVSGESEYHRRQRAAGNLARNPSLKTSQSVRDAAKALLPVLQSLLIGQTIPRERQEKRLGVCGNCDYLSLIDGAVGCGICSCKLALDDRRMINLLDKEETASYGCKHPAGSQWQKAGA